MINEQRVFILTDTALNSVIQQIKDDQWTLKIPEWFSTGRTMPDADLRLIVNYHAYDEAWVPDTLSGKTIEEVGEKYEGDLLGDNPKASFAAFTEKGIAAVEALEDPERVTHLTYGDFPARDYLMHTLLFRGLRAIDIAKLIGIDTTMPDDMIQGMWDIIAPQAEDLRAMGVFKAKVEVPEDASLQDKLIALTGRQL